MHNIFNVFKQNKLTAILRNIAKEDLEFVFSSLKKCGVKNVEITLNSKDYKSAFELLQEKYDGDFCVGAGTVVSKSEVALARSLGAGYIISPHTDVEIIRETLKNGIVSIPAAFTPSEILVAKNAGAHMVKLFPIMHLSADYVNAIMQPINDIEFLAVGIATDKIKDFKRIGIKHFAVGGDILLPPTLIKNRDEKAFCDNLIAYQNEVKE